MKIPHVRPSVNTAAKSPGNADSAAFQASLSTATNKQTVPPDNCALGRLGRKLFGVKPYAETRFDRKLSLPPLPNESKRRFSWSEETESTVSTVSVRSSVSSNAHSEHYYTDMIWPYGPKLKRDE
jgi:hypothetical protein